MLSLFLSGYLQTGTLANNEDPDEMSHYAAFYQDLFYLLRQNDRQRNASPASLHYGL